MFKAEPIKGDGNCLFRTLSVIAFGDQERWPLMKDMLGGYLQSHPMLLTFQCPDKSIVDFMTDFRRDGYWGGHLEVTAFTRLYNVRVVIHIAKTNTRTVVGEEGDLESPIFHVRFDALHYTPLQDVFFDHFDTTEIF